MDFVDNSISQTLLQSFIRFKRVKWYRSNQMDCRPSDIRLLFCLYNAQQNDGVGMKVSDISHVLHVTAPTVTQLVSSLEAKGLVQRALDHEDRRVIRVTLTEAGEKITQEARIAAQKWFSGLVEYLGEDQSSQLAELLSKVFTYVERGDAE